MSSPINANSFDYSVTTFSANCASGLNPFMVTVSEKPLYLYNKITGPNSGIVGPKYRFFNGVKERSIEDYKTTSLISDITLKQPFERCKASL